VPFVTRGLQPADHLFILGSWGVMAHNDIPYRWMVRDAWRKQYEKMCRWLQTRGQALLAVNPEDTDHILGYVAYDDEQSPLCVHFVYVKKAFRRYGLASHLLSHIRRGEDRFFISHYPRPATASLFKNAEFDPYVLWSS
jgi:GNAT superfamily N-acetyltransferase